MKKTLIVALLLGLSFAIGQAQIDIEATEFGTVDKAPQTNPNLGTRNAGDFLYYVDVEAITLDIRCLGVENLGANNDWWVTGAADMLGANLYTIDYTGATLLAQYAQGNTSWGWRDLAYDGNYLYASDSYVIEEIDPATGMATGVTIASPTSPARALAYDPVTDSFWTGNFSSDIYNIDRAGGYTAYTNPSALSVYGMAMDDTNNVLWVWSQDGSGSLASAFDPSTGTFTGESWDGGAAPYFGIAGGACIFDDPTYGTVFAGMHQATPDNVAVYEILPDPMPQLDITCNGQDAGVIVPDVSNAMLDIDIEARQGAGYNVDIWCVVQRGGARYYYDGATWSQTMAAYHTGPLADVTETILDQAVPVGSYNAYLAIDTNANGVLDMGSIFDYDVVDFTVMTISGFVEDFDDNVADGWVDDGAHWSVGTGVYLCNTPSYAYFHSYYGPFDYSNFDYSVDLRMVDTGNTSDTYDYGIYFRSQGGASTDCYYWIVQNDGAYYFRVYSGGSYTYISGTMPSYVIGVGNWNTLMVTAVNDQLDCYVNGVLDFSHVDATWSTGKVGLFGQGSGIYDHDLEYDNVYLNVR